jgi:hypothetical protein
VGRNTREQANELRAVAPLVVLGKTLELVGPCTLISNGRKVVAFSSAELLRAAGEPLAIALSLDGKRTVKIASWALARSHGLGIVELAEPVPPSGEIQPLDIGAVCAAVETRGAPAALVTVSATEHGFSRQVIPVHVDACDGGGMSDALVHLATPQDASDAGAKIDGAPLIAWMPADPVLGRGSEVVAVALAVPYRAGTYKPRELVALAELVSLDDLGRVLPYEGSSEGSNDLTQVAGEIKDA